MAINNHKKSSYPALNNKQHGAALILLAFIIGLAVIALMIKSFNVASIEADQNEGTTQALSQAKEALIAWAVSYAELPGMMPYPNRGTDSGGYEDGGSDCFASNISFNYQFLIGVLPFRDSNDTNCISLTRKALPLFQDAGGNPLWYAVSRNLVRNYQTPASNPSINPGMVNVDSLKSMPYNGTTATSPYPWLVVKDATGLVISDRVAAVIIAPGPPLAGQSRTNTASVAHFLDQIIVGANIYSNRDYDQPDEDFVMVNNAALTSSFNDRLVFITIDELISALEKRAANAAKEALIAYAATNGDNFPYAAPLGITRGFSCKEGNNAGFLPIDDDADGAESCTYSFTISTGTGAPPWWPNWLPWDPDNGIIPGVNEYSSSSTCSFDDVERVVFTRTLGGSYNSPATNNCVANGLTCTCTGAGSCSGSNVPTFSCDATGICSSAMNRRNENSRMDFEGGYFSNASGSCSPTIPICETGNGYPVQCVGTNAAAIGTFSRACSEEPLTLPDWFWANRWQDYFYYRTSRGEAADLTSGSKGGLKAILIGTGSSLNPSAIGINQSRPSCMVGGYLDSAENTAGELLKFDPNNMSKSTDYNDKVYIVAP